MTDLRKFGLDVGGDVPGNTPSGHKGYYTMSKETLGRFIGDLIYFPICNRCERYASWGRCDVYPEQIPRAILAGYASCSDYAKRTV